VGLTAKCGVHIIGTKRYPLGETTEIDSRDHRKEFQIGIST